MARPDAEITKDSASERSAEPYRARDAAMRPGARGQPGQQQAPQPPNRRDYYRANQQPNDGYYDGQRRPAARGNARQQTRIFVALFDYDPPTMSPNPDACDEELPFREGQLIKVRSSFQ